MKKSILHFSHGNGFPTETYRKFLAFLRDDFQIGYINMHGHNPDYPVTDNWDELVAELLIYLEENYHQPIIAVGHSLGGILIFLAAILKPELFRCVVLLDSPVLGHWRSQLVLLAKRLRLIDKVTSAQRTKTRRFEWPNTAAAIEYFQSKPLFKNFDPACLRDYVEYGMIATGQGIRLKFDPLIEYQIYRTLPHNLPSHQGNLKVPAALIYGRDSKVIKPRDLTHMSWHFAMKIVPIAGGHLFPFEHPELAAITTKTVITDLLA